MVDLWIEFPHQFSLHDADFFHDVIHLEQIIAGIPERFQQNRRRHLTTAINPNIQDVARVELKVQP